MKKLLTLFAIILSVGMVNAQTKKPVAKKIDTPSKTETTTATKGPSKEETLKFIKELYGATNRYFSYRGTYESNAYSNPIQLLNVELVGDRIKFTFKDKNEQTSASISGQILIKNSELYNGNEGFILAVQDGFKSDLPKLKKAIEHLQQFIEKSPFD